MLPVDPLETIAESLHEIGAVRFGDYKLLEYFDSGKMQLFNLKDDIGEQNDLMAIEPDKAERLRNLLHNWRESSGAKMMEENPSYSQ